MTSDAQKEAGYLVPNPLTGYPMICVSFMIPDTLEYIGAVRGQLKALGDWWMWEKSYQPGDRRAAIAARLFEQLIAETLVFDDQCFPEISGCTEHPLSSYILEWNPNDPFKTPDLVPDGYAFPPWYLATNTTNITLGTSLGDVVTDIVRTSSAPVIPPASGYPRLRIHLSGAGIVELHLVKINGGGYAQITTDDDVLSAEFISLAKDNIAIPPETSDDIIIERKIETPGTHHIDVLFIPLVNEELPFIGQGGAIRKIVTCGFDDMAREIELRSVVIDALCDQIQWKYTDQTEDDWQNLGTPICDGAPGEDGQNGRDPEFRLVPIDDLCKEIQTRLIGDTEWVTLGTVCDGEDGEQGIPGEQGEQGIPGEPGECPECEPGEETIPDSSGNNCAGAFGTVETLLSILNYNLDQLEFSGAVTQGVINLVSLNIIEFLSSVPLVGAIIAGLELSIEIGIGTVRSRINNPDFKEELVCWLYCAVEAEGAFNQSSFDAWIAKINEEYPAILDGAKAFVDLAQNIIGFDDISRRYAIESVNSDSRCDALCVCSDERLISWEAATSNASEGATHVVRLKLSSPDALPDDVVVTIEHTPGTASNPADYTLPETEFTFLTGSVNNDTVDVEVNIVTDAVSDDGETFTLHISSLTGSAVIDTDNDDHVVTIGEGCGGNDGYLVFGTHLGSGVYQSQVQSSGAPFQHRVRFSACPGEPNQAPPGLFEVQVMDNPGGAQKLIRARTNNCFLFPSTSGYTYNSSTTPPNPLCASAFEFANDAPFTVTIKINGILGGHS